jgi:RNA polymerase sigma-70 factor, ECF subfamily
LKGLVAAGTILSSNMPLGEAFQGVLGAAKSGAEWAIAALYRELQPGLLRYLRAQAPADGDDLASEVWLAAAAGLGRFEGDEAGFRRWLFTIAQRRLVDLRRQEARRRSLLSSLARAHERGSLDSEVEVLAASEAEAALILIAGLPPDQAEVVLLRVVGGLDTKDVAAIVGKKPGAVRVLQHRALKRLAEQLAEEKGRSVTG